MKLTENKEIKNWLDAILEKSRFNEKMSTQKKRQSSAFYHGISLDFQHYVEMIFRELDKIDKEEQPTFAIMSQMDYPDDKATNIYGFYKTRKSAEKDLEKLKKDNEDDPYWDYWIVEGDLEE